MISRRSAFRQNRGRFSSGGSGAPAYVVIAHGNSLTYGFGATDPATKSYPAILSGLRGVPVYNHGTIGIAGGALYTELPTVLANYPSGERVYILLEVGNSIAFGSTDGDVPWLKRACQMARYRGCKVISLTCYPRADLTAPQDAQRTAANAVLIADVAQYADTVCDTAAIPQFTPPGSGANPTYFVDVAHLTDAGYALKAATIDPSVTTARAATVGDHASVISGNAGTVELYDALPDYLVDRPSGVDRWFGGWGAAQLLQSTVGFRPGYNATGWNATRPVLTFDGTLRFMTCATGSAPSAINGTNMPFTIAATVRCAANDVVFGGWDHTVSGAYNELGTTGAGRLRLFRKDTAGNTVQHVCNTIALGTGATSRNRVVCSFSGSGLSRFWVNGVEDTNITTAGVSGTIGAMAFNRIMLSTLGGGAAMNGEIAEFFLGKTAWGAAEVARDYAYQKTKWGGLP